MTKQKTLHLKIFGESDDNLFVVNADTDEVVATDSYFDGVGTVQIRDHSGHHIASFKATCCHNGDWVIEPHRDMPKSVLVDLTYSYKSKKVGEYSPVVEIHIPDDYTVEVLFIDYDDYFREKPDKSCGDKAPQKYVIYGDETDACAYAIDKQGCSPRISTFDCKPVNFELYVGYRHVCTFIVNMDVDNRWYVSVKPNTLREDDKKQFNIQYEDVDTIETLPVLFFSKPRTQAISFEVPPNSNVYGYTE